MGIFTSKAKEDLRNPESPASQRQQLLDELARIRADIKALGTQRASTQELAALGTQVERLKLEKDRLEETNARNLRKAEQEADLKVQKATHEAGLLLKEREFDIDSARREAQLTVREANLAAEQKQFEDRMAFRDKHFDAEMARIEKVSLALMERLPVIEVNMEAEGRPAVRGRATRAAD